MTWFNVGAAVVSAVATVYATQKQAQAQEFNAKIADQNAEVARSQGNEREEQMRRHARAVIGTQLAATAESGTQLNGTNLDMVKGSIYNEELDANNIRYDTETRATGLNTQAMLDRSQASDTRTGGYLSAAGKLIGGSSSYLNGSGTVPSYSANNGMGYSSAAGINGGR